MAITTLNNRSINRSDTAGADQVWTATSATASDFQAAGGTNTPAFAAYMSSAQTFAENTETKIQFDTEVFDTDSAYDKDTNFRFVVPSGEGGKYLLTAGAFMYGSSVELGSTIIAYANGSTKLGTATANNDTGHGDGEGGAGSLTISVIVSLSAADYVEIFGISNLTGSVAGTPITVGANTYRQVYFSMHKLIE